MRAACPNVVYYASVNSKKIIKEVGLSGAAAACCCRLNVAACLQPKRTFISSLVPFSVPIRHAISHPVPLGLGSQNLHPRRRHRHCVLILRRPRPVSCHCRPVVGPRLVLPILRAVDHGFDRKCMPWLHRIFRSVLAVVRHIWSRVEQFANAVPTIVRTTEKFVPATYLF